MAGFDLPLGRRAAARTCRRADAPPPVSAPLGTARLETPILYRLVRCATENVHVLDEASTRFRQLLPGPYRVFDPCAELLARTRLGVLRAVNDLRSAASVLREGYPDAARAFLGSAAAKLARTRAVLEGADDLAAYQKMILEPAVLLEHLDGTLRSLAEVESCLAPGG